MLSLHILFLVISQTYGKLIECVTWMPREPPFTQRTGAKITEKFPSPWGSNSDLGGPLSGLKLTLPYHSHPSKANLKAANLEVACLKTQVNLQIMQMLPCSEVHYPCCSMTPPGASSLLCPDFQAGFSSQSLNLNNEDIQTVLQGVSTPSIARFIETT